MKLYLIITQVLYALSLIPWLMIWGLSFMSFDSGFHVYNVSFVLAITLYPVAVLVGSVLAWMFRKKKKRFAIIMNLLPIVWIMSFFAFLFIYN